MRKTENSETNKRTQTPNQQNLEANLLSIIENAEGIVYSFDNDLRYISLNSTSKNILKRILGIDPGPGHIRKTTFRRSSIQQHSLIVKFKKLVEENYLRYSLPREYAQMLSVSPKHLNDICRKELGNTAGEVIRSKKLLEAQRLLTNVDLNISQIAYQLNFADHSHFSKFFKKHTGQSPEDFRKSVINHG